MTQKEKQQAIDQLREATLRHHALLEDIEPRLAEYYDHLCQHTGTEKGDPNDHHNGFELLCALRLLRLLLLCLNRLRRLTGRSPEIACDA